MRRIVIRRKSRGRDAFAALTVTAAVIAGAIWLFSGSRAGSATAYLNDVHDSFVLLESEYAQEGTPVALQNVGALIDRAAENAQQLAQEGTIRGYEVGDNCVYMQTTDGVGLVYLPQVDDTPESVPENTPENTPENPPENVPENPPANTPERVPENTPENTPETAPGNAAATLPAIDPTPRPSVEPAPEEPPAASNEPTPSASIAQTPIPSSEQTPVPTAEPTPDEPSPAQTQEAQAPPMRRAISLQPCYDMFLWAFTSDELEKMDESVNGFADAFPTFRFDPAADDLDNAAVTPESLKALGEYDVILWEGHGGYTESTRTFLVTGQEYTNAYYRQNEADFLDGSLIATTDGRVAVTAGFFDKHLAAGSLDGALVYLATCSSCRDKTLVNTLLSKGARAVYANDGVIYTVYNYAMLERIFSQLCGQNGRFCTTGEALDEAQSVYGYIDNCALTPTPGNATNSTTVCLFGDRNMSFAP